MQSPRPPRYESLDFWRGAACLLVVVFHAGLGYVATPDLEARVRAEGGDWADWAVLAVARMWVGVPLFFVISGYCIAAAADTARSRAGGTATFFYRRARRIYPPLWAFLAVTAVAAAALPAAWFPAATAFNWPLHRPDELSAVQWAGNLTLTEEWRPNVAGPDRGYLAGHLWTLCYEEQFYLVVGLLALLAGRRLFAAVGVVTAVVFANVLDLSGTPLAGAARFQAPLSGFFFDGQWLAFAAGVGVYYREAHATPVLRRCVDGFLAAGLVWAVRQIPDGWDFGQTLPRHLAVAFGFALLLGWLRRFDARLAAARGAAPVAFCGRMCYSLYLVHAPVAAVLTWALYRSGITSPAGTLFVTVPAVVAASVATGYAFHRAVERRFLNPPAQAPTPPVPPSAARRDEPAPKRSRPGLPVAVAAVPAS